MKKMLMTGTALAVCASMFLACGRRGNEDDTTDQEDLDVISTALEQGLQDESMSETNESPDVLLNAAGESGGQSDPVVAGEDLPPPAEAEVPAGSEADALAQAESASGVSAPTEFFLLLGWGRFPYAPGSTPEQLTGSLDLSVGGIRVLRRVALEPLRQGDFIRRDITTPLRKLNIRSTIGCCMDGVAIKVVLHEDLNQSGTSTPREATLTLNFDGQQPLSLQLNPSVETVHQTTTLANGMVVTVQGFQRKSPLECKEGYMLGRWVRKGMQDGRELGRFAGRYLASDGTRTGFVRGVFGQKANGERVFYGKIVGVDGVFKGFMAGSYTGDQFSGMYYRTRAQVKGAVEGRAVVAASGDRGALGAFRGRWSEMCGEVANEQ